MVSLELIFRFRLMRWSKNYGYRVRVKVRIGVGAIVRVKIRVIVSIRALKVTDRIVVSVKT